MEQIGRSNYPTDKAKQLRFLSPFLSTASTQNNCKMEQQEIWKDIKGYEGLYQISNLGRVKSLERLCRSPKGNRRVCERILSMSAGKARYYTVPLAKNGVVKSAKIHRLVATHFIPNPMNYPCINHKDENLLNNRVENLEWCSKEENRRYGTKQERMLNTRRLRDLPNKGISIVGIDPQTNEIRVRFESLREAHCNGYYRASIATRIKNNSKTLYKGLIWQKVG